MKIFTVCIFLLCFTSTVFGGTITLDGGNISFEVIDEFKPIPKEWIELKFPGTSGPKYAIGNESGSTTISYDLKPHIIPQDKIDEIRAEFTKMLSKRMPEIKWVENKTIELSGRKWVYFEMTSTAIDTDVYNIMLFTGYKDQMLVFNFNSTKEEFQKYELALRKSIKTINIIKR